MEKKLHDFGQLNLKEELFQRESQQELLRENLMKSSNKLKAIRDSQMKEIRRLAKKT